MQNNVPATFTARPGHRLVPAKVGRTNATSVIVHIECPVWCDGSEHLTEPVVHVEDITHVSKPDDIVVQTFLGRATRHVLWATVQADPVATDPRQRAAHVVVEDGSDYSYLTEDMADALADDLIAFASAVRQKARIARLANQAPAVNNVRNQADEALQRVRGVQV